MEKPKDGQLILATIKDIGIKICQYNKSKNTATTVVKQEYGTYNVYRFEQIEKWYNYNQNSFTEINPDKTITELEELGKNHPKNFDWED